MPLATEKYWCVVPAAGVGMRMGAALPKQYLTLAGKRVAEHTLETLLRVSLFSGIVVATSDDDLIWPSLAVSRAALVQRCVGGSVRSESVLNGLRALSSKASPQDWVLVHDIARPCLRLNDIQTLITRLHGHAVGGILATPVRDTMKRANPRGEIVSTVDRTLLWHALTPQMLRYQPLCDALEQAQRTGLALTDEASAMESLGLSPLLVEGHVDNIKITHPQDLALAELFLKQQALEREQQALEREQQSSESEQHIKEQK
ncbi:2-C-methyl-D-erythritol 4-phosphate cytidylyltransferase 1 [gamma proteobacterium HdN1]|nr:2-C-methyl-D-erythritol 4-phosphate cytidylyltransferase 1 [gamma proteobacterium HdN1]